MKSEKKKTSRDLQAEQTRDKIVNCVKEHAKVKPIDEMRIQEICKECGISLGNFYSYFSCKEQALIFQYQVIDEYWKSLNFEAEQDPRKRVRTIIDTHLDSIVSEPLTFITSLYLSQLRKFDEYFFKEDRYLHHVLADAIKECQEAGICTTKYEATELSIKLLNFSRGLVYNYCIRHEEKPEEWITKAKAEHLEFESLFFKD